MKVALRQFERRKTFEEVADIVQKDAYKIDLPERTRIRWDDTYAKVQFDQFRDSTRESEMNRVHRQAVEAQIIPPTTATAPISKFGPSTGLMTQFTDMAPPSKAPSKAPPKAPPPGQTQFADVVMRDTSRDGNEPDSGGASGSAVTPMRKRQKAPSEASTRAPTTPGDGGNDPGDGGSAGSATTVSKHELQTLMRHYSAENSFAQGKLQEALTHHTQAHALSVQNQIEAFGLSLAHEARRSDARDIMTRETAKSLEAATKNQLALLPKAPPTSTQLDLDRMRAETTASTTAVNRQESLLNQIGQALGGVLSHAHGQATKIDTVLAAVAQPQQTVLNQYGTLLQDNRSVHQHQNVLNQDNRSVEQKILNLFYGGASSSSSSGSAPPGGGGGGGGGGRPRAPRPVPEFDMAIDDEPKQEKRAAIAIEDRKKKKKTNPPDVPIALPDRSGQAKRKPQIPDEAPENVKKLGRQLVKMIARNAPKPFKAMQKSRHATPHIVDIGEPLSLLPSNRPHAMCSRAKVGAWQTTTLIRALLSSTIKSRQ